ncbi:unnamed protein product [Brugia timori]|uniref:Bm13129, isoform d n=2 Tax=Brugia TaxID=6278 RepID=A0A1I9G3G8_BRUMA|nr:Bm13129, isoform d [Brugia malayi]VDO10957.1 unnamed protein product [Brugia timori]
MQADSPIHGDSAKYPRLRIEIYPNLLSVLKKRNSPLIC